jgi:hypothetical protein
MQRFIAAILLIAVLVVGGGIIATTAYQVGLSTAVTTATASSGTVATPVVVPPYGYGYGYGWHPFAFGFGIFGFLGTLLFLFIIFGLIRALVFRGGPGRRGGWGGRDHSPWEDRAHETFERWHEGAHSGPPDRPSSGSSTPADPS